jgi:hypothetical protein
LVAGWLGGQGWCGRVRGSRHHKGQRHRGQGRGQGRGLVAGGIPGGEIGARASSGAGLVGARARGRWLARAARLVRVWHAGAMAGACGMRGRWLARAACGEEDARGAGGHGDAVDALAIPLRCSRDYVHVPIILLFYFLFMSRLLFLIRTWSLT